MTQLMRESVTCPGCGACAERELFRSLSGDRVPAQVAAILDRTFEQMACEECGRRFQPEHRMLYAHPARGAWIVMYPRDQRARFAAHEHGVRVLFEREFQRAPAELAGRLADARPRLVFGQHMLAEAVRQSEDAVDPVAVECAKLLLYRRRMADLVPHGPIELALEDTAPEAALRFAVHRLGGGDQIATLTAGAELLDEVEAAREDFEARYPELFSHGYLSATRYLFAE